MSTLAKLEQMKNEIINEIYDKLNDAEENRLHEFRSALKIQSWFRMQRIKHYIKHLNRSVLRIQKLFRGYQGRKRYRQILKEKVYIMKLNHYNKLASTIQKYWRGYYTRKYIFNFYSRKRYLEALQMKNKAVREELAEYSMQKHNEAIAEYEHKQRQNLLDYAAKNHHLVSTKVMPGIYNSPFQLYPSEMEHHLRNTKLTVDRKTKDTKKYNEDKDVKLSKPALLPSINKPQGPFRNPEDVIKQRYKPLQPSLRVATKFSSVEEAREEMKREEWSTRLIDKEWLPFTKRTTSYEPLLHTTAKYGAVPYGTNYFREEKLYKNIAPKDFISVVPPIPIFEKLNNTYSQGQV